MLRLRLTLVPAWQRAPDLDQITEMIAVGAVTPTIESVYVLEDV